jgi:uncharacterized DUF497 family protein
VTSAVDGFDWDRHNRDKCREHGVPTAEIEALFGSPIQVRPDLAHAEQEERFQAIGRSAEGRAIFVVFTIRERDGLRLIRPISARYMHAREIAHYETENPEA